MKQFNQISTINNVNLPKGVEAEIQKYSQKEIVFYQNDSIPPSGWDIYNSRGG